MDASRLITMAVRFGTWPKCWVFPDFAGNEPRYFGQHRPNDPREIEEGGKEDLEITC
jgi:hypothetical protein